MAKGPLPIGRGYARIYIYVVVMRITHQRAVHQRNFAAGSQTLPSLDYISHYYTEHYCMKCLHHEHACLYRLLVSSLASYLASYVDISGQPSIANVFNCCCLVINPTRNERFIVSFTVAIEELIILICC